MTSSISIDEIKAAIEKMPYEEQLRLSSWLYAWTSVQRDRMGAKGTVTQQAAPFPSMPGHYDQDIDDYRL